MATNSTSSRTEIHVSSWGGRWFHLIKFCRNERLRTNNNSNLWKSNSLAAMACFLFADQTWTEVLTGSPDTLLIWKHNEKQHLFLGILSGRLQCSGQINRGNSYL